MATVTEPRWKLFVTLAPILGASILYTFGRGNWHWDFDRLFMTVILGTLSFEFIVFYSGFVTPKPDPNSQRRWMVALRSAVALTVVAGGLVIFLELFQRR